VSAPVRLAVALGLAIGLAASVGPAPALAPASAVSVSDVRGPGHANAPGPAGRVPGSRGANATPTVVAVYPNPPTDRDRGEFVRVAAHGANLSRYRLTDGEHSFRLPDADRITLTDAPGFVGNLTGDRTHRAALSLANGGERVRLVGPNGTVSVARYDGAPEAEVYARTDTPRDADSADAPRWRWHPLGATDRPVTTGGPANVTAFVLPDAPGPPVGTLRTAEERILLAGYTFTSERATDALVRARERGVRVRVLLEGSPIGGITRRQARLLDRLADAGVDVRVIAGPYDRYAYHHAKYAVVDDRALVLTENWKPAGTGGHSSRGWGALVRDPAVARALAATFRTDAGWRDAIAWERFRRGRAFERPRPADNRFERRFAPREYRVEATRLAVTPDAGTDPIVDVLDAADESVRVVGASIDREATPTRALVRAARRGVRVRVLLSSASYVREEHRQLADSLNGLADREGLPLTAKLADPRGYEKIHAKGVVVDGERVVVGSLNWNPQSARENREVLLVLEGESVAGYYARVFDADWGHERWPLPPLGLAALGLAILCALAALRRIDFGEEVGVGPPGEGREREREW